MLRSVTVRFVALLLMTMLLSISTLVQCGGGPCNDNDSMIAEAAWVDPITAQIKALSQQGPADVPDTIIAQLALSQQLKYESESANDETPTVANIIRSGSAAEADGTAASETTLPGSPGRFGRIGTIVKKAGGTALSTVQTGVAGVQSGIHDHLVPSASKFGETVLQTAQSGATGVQRTASKLGKTVSETAQSGVTGVQKAASKLGKTVSETAQSGTTVATDFVGPPLKAGAKQVRYKVVAPVYNRTAVPAAEVVRNQLEKVKPMAESEQQEGSGGSDAEVKEASQA